MCTKYIYISAFSLFRCTCLLLKIRGICLAFLLIRNDFPKVDSICCAQNLGLYPRESETREVKKLDGVWNFRIIPMGEDQNIGFTQKWYSQPLQLVRYLILIF